MTAFLPLDVPFAVRRAAGLKRAQRRYEFNYTHVSPLALLDRVPIEDEFSFGWLKTVAGHAVVGLENLAAIEMDGQHRELHRSKLSLFSKLLHLGEAGLHDLKALVTESLQFNPRLASDSRRPVSLDDYSEVFHSIGLPPIARDFKDDRVFAWMRVGGPNAVMLQRVNELDDRFPVNDAHLRSVLSGDTLVAAIAEGRLYMVDFHMLDGAPDGDYPHGQKYIYAPLAMFVIDPRTKTPLPFAIQIKQQPAADDPVFTPQDGWNEEVP